MKTITTAEYHEYEESFIGYCTNCDDFTGESCEPDAERYLCPECEERKVYGMMNAVLMGLIDIKED